MTKKTKAIAGGVVAAAIVAGVVVKNSLTVAPPVPRTVTMTWDYPEPMPSSNIVFVVTHKYDLLAPVWEVLTNAASPPLILDASQPAEFFAMYASNELTGEIAWNIKTP